VISCHSRDIGIDCLHTAITIRMTDEVMGSILKRNDTPSVLMNLVKVAVCGSGSSAFESTSHMP
jgi:hypothetical protein